MAYLCYLVETTKNFRLVKNAEFHLQPLSKRCLPACKRCSDVCCALNTHACTNWFDKVHTLTIVYSLVRFCNLQRKVNGWLGFWFGLTSFDAIARAWAWSKRCWCRYCCTMLDKQCMCCVRDFKIIRFSTLILPIAFRCSDSQKNWQELNVAESKHTKYIHSMVHCISLYLLWWLYQQRKSFIVPLHWTWIKVQKKWRHFWKGLKWAATAAAAAVIEEKTQQQLKQSIDTYCKVPCYFAAQKTENKKQQIK